MKLSPWRVLLVLIDVACVAVAMLVSAVLLNDGQIAPLWHKLRLCALLTVALVPLCHGLVGLYSRIWEYASVSAAVAIVTGVTGTVALSYTLCRLLGINLPLALWYTTWLTSVAIVGGTRLAWRMIRPVLRRSDDTEQHRILIYGAGPEGTILPVALTRLYDNSYYVVGYLDDNSRKRGLIIGNARVLGTLEDLPHVVSKYRVEEVVITIPLSERDRLRSIFDRCSQAGVRARTLPPILEAIEDSYIAPREVLAEDLLEREWSPAEVRLEADYLADRTVLVTGAGGSIGSELCRQLCRYPIRRLLLLGRGENRIHWIYLYLRNRFPELEIIPIIQNVTTESGMRQVFAQYRPAVVFHAAAHKHVYLMEAAPIEAVRNNVGGTRLMADLAEEYKVERFVFISTDKAVAPSSVMGATKRVGELLLTSRPYQGTEFVCVRFGNVLGSEGSVLEIFRRQWRRREPLTVTDARATRYFMSIPEACFLVLQAGSLGRHGQIFLLDMGEAVSVLKLAQEFILLHGGNPFDPAAIRLTGLTHGEKLHEALTYADEDLLATADDRIMQVASHSQRPQYEPLRQQIEHLEAEAAAEAEAEVCLGLNAITHSTLAPCVRAAAV